MEKPEGLKSKISNQENLTIVTPNSKSFILIFFLSIISFQMFSGMVGLIVSKDKPPVIALIFMLLIFGTIFFFAFREVLWQIIGKSIITVSNETLTIKKKGSYFFKEKVYDIKEIENLSLHNNSASIGPLAMLQLLKVIDSTKVTFAYGFKTVKLLSGIDPTESNYIIDLLNNRIKSDN